MNPILAREIRARFRDKRSFWLLFGLTAFLCLAAAWIYQDAAFRAAQAEEQMRSYAANSYGYNPYGYSYYDVSYTASLRRQAAQTGRDLFRTLALGNAIAWLLIAPALTATGLAKERERGLLESLWLSPFRVRDQIAGRMGATLLFLFILQLTALPIYGIAVLLGGVSPGEIGIASAIIAATAFVGTSLGMWCSARSQRPANALGAAFFLIALWSALAYWQLLTIFYSISGGNWANFTLAFGHPTVLMQSVLSERPLLAFGTAPYDRADILKVGLALQIVASIFLLWAATRKAAHPLPEVRWQERNPVWKRWRAHIEAQKAERKRREEAARLRENVAGALLYELPIERLVRFRDPLLSREVKSRFRLRAGNFTVSALRSGAFLVAAGFWIWAAFSATDTVTRATTGQALLLGLWGCGILAMGVMAGSSLTRERESGTWEGLKLSLLPVWQITRSKWLAPLIAFAYWSAAGWILVPLFLPWSAWGTGIAPGPMLGAVLIIVFSLGAACALGLYISSRAPHSAAGTSWTLAVLLVILAGFPALDSLVNLSERVSNNYFGPQTLDQWGRPITFTEEETRSPLLLVTALGAYHPVLTLQNLLDERGTNSYYDAGAPLDGNAKTAIVLLNLSETAFATAILLFLIARRVRKTEDS